MRDVSPTDRRPGPAPHPPAHRPCPPLQARAPLPPAPFPRPSPLFVGRQDELARCRRLLEHSPLLLAYGVPGIGKTEFIYQLVAELRATRRWRRTPPILLQAQAGQRLEQLVAQLGS